MRISPSLLNHIRRNHPVSLQKPPAGHRNYQILSYRGTSLIRKRPPLGPYSRTMPRNIWGSYGGGRFLMSEVLLYLFHQEPPPPRTLQG